jgi:hypothetical protein
MCDCGRLIPHLLPPHYIKILLTGLTGSGRSVPSSISRKSISIVRAERLWEYRLEHPKLNQLDYPIVNPSPTKGCR